MLRRDRSGWLCTEEKRREGGGISEYAAAIQKITIVTIKTKDKNVKIMRINLFLKRPSKQTIFWGMGQEIESYN